MRSLTLLLALCVVTGTTHAQNADTAQNRSVIVTNTPNGFVLADVPGAPLADDVSAVLLTAPADGSRGWTMRSLSPGENPAEVLANRRDDIERLAHHRMALDLQREGANRHRIVSQYHRDRLARQRDLISDGDGEILEIIDGDIDVIGDGELIDVPAVRRMDRGSARLRSIEVTNGGRSAVRHEVKAELAQPLDLNDPLVAALVADDALAGLEVTETNGTTHLQIVFAFGSVDDWKAWMADPANTETIRAIRDRAEDSMTRTKVDIR